MTSTMKNVTMSCKDQRWNDQVFDEVSLSWMRIVAYTKTTLHPGIFLSRFHRLMGAYFTLMDLIRVTSNGKRKENIVSRYSCNFCYYDRDHSVITLTWSCMQSHLDPWTTMTMRLTSRRRRIKLHDVVESIIERWRSVPRSALHLVCGIFKSFQSWQIYDNVQTLNLVKVKTKGWIVSQTCDERHVSSQTTSTLRRHWLLSRSQIRSRLMDTRWMMMIIKWFNS